IALPVTLWVFAAAFLLSSFAILFWMQRQVASLKMPRWLTPWYVHASNGFYVDSVFRRLFGRLAST
ncbi:MAG: hypothetical protein AAF745_14185, partial [Planctomycetota bacterium]